ncbi:MAG: DNA polymerase I, partial [Actinobacteria bacterium]|nr:DNA polymerase I [Actinomycetota bacterium]
MLLDGHSLAYRAFHALPEENFSTSTGQATNAVYGFTSMLLNVLRDERPTHIAVAFDVSRRTFRTEAFPEYKATRSASPASFRGQVDLIREVLAALRIRTFEVEGFEADDIIATLTRQARAAGFEVDILTGDRDTFQLVSDTVTVLYPKKGVSELQRTTPELVIEKYGLRPDQYADYAALRGDPSDNLPGIPGVGEKTAAKWLQQYHDLTGLLEHAHEVSGKVGESLRACVEQVRLNRHLTQLVDEVPLGADVAELCVVAPDSAAVSTLFDTLQFRTLLSRVPAMAGSQAAAAQPAVEVVIARDVTVADWLQVRAGACVGLASSAALLALAVESGAALVVDVAALAPSERAALSSWWADAGSPKSAYSSKQEHRVLDAALGAVGAGFVLDVSAAAYLLAPGQPVPPLADIARRHLSMAVGSQDVAPQQELFADDAVAGRASLAEQAVASAALVGPLAAALAAQGAEALMHDVEIPVARVLASLEATGVAVDTVALRALEQEFADQASAVEARAHSEAGRAFNLSSPKQLQELLFEERGLPHTKRIKTGYSTDVEALTYLSENSDDPLPQLLLQFREVSRLRQTITGLITSTADDGRIHTTFQQFVAATGRLSSTDPNLQNIPVRTEDGRRIRAAFVVGDGYDTLLTADYSQIELRLMAHLSQDKGLIAAFAAGEDIHTTVAAGVFGVAEKDVDAGMRRKVKAMAYGLAYGLSAFGLAQQLRIEQSEARALMDDYFGRFDGVRRFLADVVDKARAVGYTETMLGRRRYLPDLTSDNRQRRDIAERMALNAPIQGTAADIMKIAMIRAHDGLAGLRSRLLLQVHDELVVEVAAGELEQVRRIVGESMEHAVSL